MADDGQKFIITLVLLSIVFLGFVGLFNLGGDLTPALDVGFDNMNTTIDGIWTILLRIIIAPAMIIIPIWVIFKVWTEL